MESLRLYSALFMLFKDLRIFKLILFNFRFYRKIKMGSHKDRPSLFSFKNCQGKSTNFWNESPCIWTFGKKSLDFWYKIVQSSKFED